MALDYFCCDIYVTATDATSTGNHLQIETDKNKLHVWYAKLFAFMDKKLGDFVWNREPLQLFVDMRGKGKFVRDSDGEFLLAEAAMHIPHWITPENSEHRVYIYRNQLHIVPLSAGSENIGINDALAAVMDSGIFTLASAPAAAAAFSRLDYPVKLSQSMHRARCKLPVALARVLSDQPQLIAAASEAFYDREPTQMSVCQRMSRFPPEPSAMVSVQFNRVQYAKITSQDMHVPLAFNLPSVDSDDYKASVLGMKVACGFEILNHEYSQLTTKPTSKHTERSDVQADTTGFLELLGQLGYFDGLAVTPEQFLKRRTYAVRQLVNSQSAGAMSEDLLAQSAVHELAATAADGEWQTADTAIASDEDESWLALNSDELDTVMRKAESVLHDAAQSDPASEFEADDDDKTAQDLQSMLAKFESFLAADSGIEGANVMNAHSDDEYAETSDEDVDLDADGIIGALMEALGAEELARTPKTSGMHDAGTTLLDSANTTETDSGSVPKNDNIVEMPSKTSRQPDILECADQADAAAHNGERSINNSQIESPGTEDTYAGVNKRDADAALTRIMSAMDYELSGTNVGKSFFRHDQTDDSESAQEHEDSDYELDDVNFDLNLVHNIIESFQAQEGLSGPAGTMLGQAGIHLPRSGNAGGKSPAT
ncbi:hypothetical protein GGH96_001076 [Coemansia sp. RSA 1972]|nr:hypothetical protein GGH96_001076 [Coemansia sp. RSA 1972]